MHESRFFFGFGLDTLWPEKLPFSKVIDEKNRHLTLVFLGEKTFEEIDNIKKELPFPEFETAPVAEFDKCLFLPEKKPRLVAWHVNFLEKQKQIIDFQRKLLKTLKEKGFCSNHREEFLAHVTICRDFFDKEIWEKEFQKLPVIIKNFSLYESLGSSKYRVIWQKDFLLPFVEIEHTADIAFRVRGRNIEELKLHSFIALCFKFRPVILFHKYLREVNTIEELIMLLNEILTKVDIERGSIFKAVSFNTKIIEKNAMLEWEMIIDV